MNNPEKMAQAAKDMGMEAIALTDHGTLGGVPEFFLACQKVGIKPILGIEAYYVSDASNKKVFKSASGRDVRVGYHLTLLAKNLIGFNNLVRLNNFANIHGFYYKPKIDWKMLEKYHEGLIALSGCVSSEFNDQILGDNSKEAERVAKRFLGLFGEDFFIEVMENGMTEELQRSVTKGAIPLAKKLGIKIVPTNDTHYLVAESKEYHDMMFKISKRQDVKKKAYYGKKSQTGYDGVFHLKSFEEMYKLFGNLVLNTKIVSDRIESYDILHKQIRLPNQMDDSHNILTMMAKGGLIRRGLGGKPEYMDRLNKELAIVNQMQFSNYFTTAKEIIEIIRESNCPLGWGRGSGGSSLICYCLEITDVDPLKYSLLFERFISEHRPDWPDVDIDIPASHRDGIIRKMIGRFGSGKVAHISTCNTFKPKMLIRDICREMNISRADTDRYSALVPFGAQKYEDILDTKLEEALSKNSQGRFLMKAFHELVGVHRHAGIHASGIVISCDEVADFIPVRQEEVDGEDRLVTQYTMDYIDKFGFLKFDILGLKRLDVIHAAAQEANIDIRSINFENEKPFELISQGQVTGMFQLDASKTCAELCKEIKPSNITDIAIILALHRPGVMDSDQFGIYLRRRKKQEETQYFHPGLEPILRDTLGVCIFQEDLMRMSVIFAEYTPAEVENLRKGIGKKDMSIIHKHLKIIEERAKRLGRSYIDQVLQQIEAAGRYSFNRSHAVEYAHVTYACAYLSFYHPLEFFKHLVSSAADDKERSTYLSALINRNIKLLPPDVNISDKQTSISEGALRLGLRSMKGVGDMTVKEIFSHRPFTDAKYVVEVVNSNVYSSLHAAGALGSVPNVDKYPPKDQLEEVDVLGISLQGLMKDYGDIVKIIGAIPSKDVGAGSTNILIKITDVRITTDKNKKTMAFLTGVDVYGPKIDGLVLFASNYDAKNPPEKGMVYQAIVSRTGLGSLAVHQLLSATSIRQAHGIA